MSVSVVAKNTCLTTGEGPFWEEAASCLVYVDITQGDVHRWNSVTNEDVSLHLGLLCFIFVTGCNVLPTMHLCYELQYDTIRYNDIYVRPKLTYRQLNLPHRTKQKRIMKKLKIKTEMLRRNGPVIKTWSQS